MEYAICVQNKNIRLKGLIENRLPAESRLSKELYIEKDLEETVVVYAKSAAEALVLSDILSDIIIENLQIRFLLELLQKEYPFLSDKERCEILIITARELWYGRKNEPEYTKARISARIAAALFESGTFYLDSFIHFRMKDWVSVWERAARAAADEYLRQQEEYEAYELLKWFVNAKPPMAEMALIKERGEGYIVLSESGCINKSEPFSPEELLFYLANLAPRRIDMHEVTDESLKKIIGDIFEKVVLL